MDYTTKEIIAGIGIAVGFIGLVPYLLDIFRNRTKPHLFSWFIWSFLTGTAFFGQLADGAGAGAWVLGLNSVCCAGIFLLSLKLGEKEITRSDKITFLCALMAIPLWLVTHTPLYSMILVTCIDMLGFYPTFRKSWNKPHDETNSSYAMSGLMYICSVASLERYTLITTLYPASLIITDFVFVAYVLWRRAVVKREEQ